MTVLSVLFTLAKRLAASTHPPNAPPSNRGRRHGNRPTGDEDIRIAMTLAVVATLTLAANAIHLEAAGAETQARHKPDGPPHGNQAQFAGHRHGDQAWQWNWQVWLPDKYRRVFHCETPTNGQYINWQHNSGTYQGGPGFAVSSWDAFKPVAWWPDEAYDATPWQQYQTARAIVARYGFSGWGCRNA